MGDGTYQLLQGAIAMGTIATILLVVLLVAIVNPQLVDQIRSAIARRGSGAGVAAVNSPGMNVLVGVIGAIAPDIGLISGYLGDIVAGEFRYSMTSIVAIIATLINLLVWGGLADISDKFKNVSGAVRNVTTGASSGRPRDPTQDIVGPDGVGHTIASGPATALGFMQQTAQAASVPEPVALPSATTAVVDAVSNVQQVVAPVQAQVGRSQAQVRRSQAQVKPVKRRGSFPTTIPGSGINEPAGNPTINITYGSANDRAIPESTDPLRKSSRFSKPSLAAREAWTGRGREQEGGFRVPQEFANTNPTVVRGLGFLDTQKSPMGIVILTCIFMVYVWDMGWNQKRSRPELVGNIIFGAFVLAMNFASYNIFESYGDNVKTRILNSGKAVIVGGLVGTIAFWIFHNLAPEYLPVDPSPASINGGFTPSSGSCPSGQQLVNGRCQTIVGTPKCGGPNGSDQFQCDLYQNGKKITTSLV